MTENTLTPKIRLGKHKSGEIFRLQRFMEERNLTPEDICASTGVSVRTITHCLYDQNPIGIKLFRALHDIYGVSCDWLLSGNGHMLLATKEGNVESPVDFSIEQSDRTRRIIGFINDWMSYTSEDEQAWLETELKFKISQYREYLKQNGDETSAI